MLLLQNVNEVNYLAEGESRKVEEKQQSPILLTLPRKRRQKDGGLQYCSNNATTPGASYL